MLPRRGEGGAGRGTQHTLCEKHYWKGGRATYIQVVGQGLAGHLLQVGVLLADGIRVCLQKVLQEPMLLQGLSQRLAFVQRDPEETGKS